MATAKLYTPSGEEKGSVDLPAWAFGVPINRHVMWEAVRNFLANQRQGTRMTKNRKLVSGGGKKPWAQKKTGRARAGTSRSPIWVGGARAFGGQIQNHKYELPKKIRRLAVRSALSLKARQEQISVLTEMPLHEVKTREVYQVLRNLGLNERKTLIVLAEHDEKVLRATRNLPMVRTAAFADLNTYHVLHSDRLVLLQSTVDRMSQAEVQV